MLTQKKLTIIIDTREQKPYSFSSVKTEFDIVRGTLKTGDYSLKGFEDKITVERKSMSDAFGSFGNGRKRLEKEMIRMGKFTFVAFVIEADWEKIFKSPPVRSKLNPKTIYSTIIAWEQRYGVHFWLCPNRSFAEKTTFRILERFWNDVNDGKGLLISKK